MTDAELDALVGLTRFDLEQADSHMGSASMSQEDYGDWVRYDDASSAITTLRAQLAAETARADRAEAERAAQIEVDAGIADATAKRAAGKEIEVKSLGMSELVRSWSAVQSHMTAVAHAIRAQPHDRSALDRLLAGAEARGYQLAADEAKRSGWHLRRHDLAKRDADLATP